jgi:hypothetical protein
LSIDDKFFWIEEFMGFVGCRKREEFFNGGGGMVEDEEMESTFFTFRDFKFGPKANLSFHNFYGLYCFLSL